MAPAVGVGCHPARCGETPSLGGLRGVRCWDCRQLLTLPPSTPPPYLPASKGARGRYSCLNNCPYPAVLSVGASTTPSLKGPPSPPLCCSLQSRAAPLTVFLHLQQLRSLDRIEPLLPSSPHTLPTALPQDSFSMSNIASEPEFEQAYNGWSSPSATTASGSNRI